MNAVREIHAKMVEHASILLVPTNVPAVRSSQEKIVRLVRYMKSQKSREIYLFCPTFFTFPDVQRYFVLDLNFTSYPQIA